PSIDDSCGDVMSKPVAIITGAGKGIGRATALELTSRGYDVVLTARTDADLKVTADVLGGGLTIAGDVSDPSHATKVVEDAMRHFGRIDALVNNAGYAPARSIEELTLDEWRQIVDVNLSAVV